MMKSVIIISLVLFVSKFGSTNADSKLAFKLSPVQAKFDIAQGAKDCEHLGGELLHSGLLHEQYVETIKKIVKENSGGMVYIGLNDREAEGKFKWVDGTPMVNAFIKFDKGQPDNWRVDNPKHGEDCVMIRQSFKLNDITCQKKYRGRALCEIRVPDLSFKLTPVQAKFDIDQGAEDCAKLGGELLHRGLLQQRYVETIKKIVKESSGGYVHIGLNDRKSEGKFKYVDGTAMTIPFIKFAKGQPDNYRKVDKKNGEDCVNIRKSWELNDIPCKGFYPGMALCEIEKPELSFKLTPVQAKFDIAQGVKDCAKLGGELLHRGLLQQRYIATIKKMVLGNKKSFVYVGLNDRKEEGKFTWIDSSQYTMTNPLIKFDKGQPDNWLVDNPKDGEDCVMIRKSFKLNDITCQKKYRGRALCEIEH